MYQPWEARKTGGWLPPSISRKTTRKWFIMGQIISMLIMVWAAAAVEANGGWQVVLPTIAWKEYGGG